MNRLRQWWRRINRPYVVTAYASKGSTASVVLINGRSVQIEVQCCRPDCPYAKQQREPNIS
jgi:hypothetical protein